MCAWFVSATITKVNNTCYTLTIINTWYFVFTHKEYFVFTTLAEAKAKLLENRCKGNLLIKE